MVFTVRGIETTAQLTWTPCIDVTRLIPAVAPTEVLIAERKTS